MKVMTLVCVMPYAMILAPAGIASGTMAVRMAINRKSERYRRPALQPSMLGRGADSTGL